MAGLYNGNSEILCLGSDGDIEFYSGSNTWANRKKMVFKSNGDLHFSGGSFYYVPNVFGG